ncbi:MAG: hydrogenase maturation nickel metallochaperone HypA [Armatimonadota bacterium]|nr:hydrogenase maturation nickel metallochaperone HypA [Armatimonadota bacterium]
MPHEVDMTKALIMSLKEWRAAQPAALPVKRVMLVVGQFTCVEPALLASAFTRQKQNTFLQDAELVIRDSPFIAYCEKCEDEYRPEIGLRYACPACGATLDEIRSGRELKVERVEWDDGPS